MYIRTDVVVSKDPRSKSKPWITRWWGKYDEDIEKQPRKSRSFSTKKLAERFAHKMKVSENRDFFEKGKVTVEQLCDKFLKAHKADLKPSSYDAYMNTVSRLKNYFAPYAQIGTIGKEEAQTFINNLTLIETDEIVSDSTRSRHLRQSKRIFNVAKEWGYIKINPFQGIKLGKIKKKDWHPITIEQFSQILNAVDKYAKVTKKNEEADKIRILRLKAFYSVMYYCGLRLGEASNLLWADNIDFKNNQINVLNRAPQKDIPHFYIKDNEARSIPVPEKIMDMLIELKEKSDSPFIFLSQDGYIRVKNRWIKYRDSGKDNWNCRDIIYNARRDFKWFVEKANIKTGKILTIHSLRKGYGTNMANLGIPVNTLKELMGHSSIVTTMEFYIKTLDDNKKMAAEKLNGVVRV